MNEKKNFSNQLKQRKWEPGLMRGGANKGRRPDTNRETIPQKTGKGKDISHRKRKAEPLGVGKMVDTWKKFMTCETKHRDKVGRSRGKRRKGGMTISGTKPATEIARGREPRW